MHVVPRSNSVVSHTFAASATTYQTVLTFDRWDNPATPNNDLHSNQQHD